MKNYNGDTLEELAGLNANYAVELLDGGELYAYDTARESLYSCFARSVCVEFFQMIEDAFVKALKDLGYEPVFNFGEPDLTRI